MSSFRNIIFSSYLEFRTMSKVQKPSDSECYHRQNALEFPCFSLYTRKLAVKFRRTSCSTDLHLIGYLLRSIHHLQSALSL
jgi:hypothetical protein